MDKEEIIRRLKKISGYAVHVVGEPPFILSLDDGIALDEAVRLLKEQEAVESTPLADDRRYVCGNCGNSLWVSGQRFCASCGKKVKWDG